MISRLHHVAVVVPDADAALTFYRDTMGLTVTGDEVIEEQGVRGSSLGMVIHERHFRRHDFMIWQSYGTVQPVFVLRFDGVPIVSVYRRPTPR